MSFPFYSVTARYAVNWGPGEVFQKDPRRRDRSYLRRTFNRIDHVGEPRTSPIGAACKTAAGCSGSKRCYAVRRRQNNWKSPPSITKRSETRARNPKPIGEPFVSTNRCRERITMRFLFSLRFSAVGRVKRVPLCPSTTTKGAPERVVISNYKVYDCEKRPLWLKARVSFTRLTTQKRFRARATSIASDRNVRIAADGDSNPCLKISPHENSSGTIWVKNLFFFFSNKNFFSLSPTSYPRTISGTPTTSWEPLP